MSHTCQHFTQGFKHIRHGRNAGFCGPCLGRTTLLDPKVGPQKTQLPHETAARSLVGNQDEYQSLWNQSLPVMQTLQSVTPTAKITKNLKWRKKTSKCFYRNPYIWDSIIWVAFVTEIGLPGWKNKEMVGTITPGWWRGSITSMQSGHSLGQPPTWNKCIIYIVHTSEYSTKSRNGMLSQESLRSHSMWILVLHLRLSKIGSTHHFKHIQ